MDFEWDDKKRAEVMFSRGVDFREAILIFEGPVLTKVDKRQDYGETRYVSTGMVENQCFVVVHTQRGDFTRIISAWLGGRRDERKYQASIAHRN